MKFIDFIKDFINPKLKIGSAETVTQNLKQEMYFKALAFHIGVSYIAGIISKCEFKTFIKNKEVKEEDYFKLNFSPNINENSSELWHKVVEKMYYAGEALIVEKNGHLFCADSFCLYEKDVDGNKYSVIIDDMVYEKIYKADEVFIFKLGDEKIKKLIDGIFETYGQIINIAIKGYRKSNGSKYKLKISNLKAGDKEFNETYKIMVEKQLKPFMSNDEAVYPEFEGYSLEEMKPHSTIKDCSDIFQIKKDIFETVAHALKIPQSLMLGNITNMNEVVKTFITFAIEPITTIIGKELTRKQGYKRWKEGNYIKVDTSKINHIDILDVAEKVDKLISSGVLCVDETRGIIDMQPLETEFGKTHFITKNYDTSENRLKGGENNE